MTICWSNFLLSVKLSLLGVDSSDWLRRTPADHEVRLGSFKHCSALAQVGDDDEICWKIGFECHLTRSG